MSEETKAAAGLEESLKGFDVTGDTGGSFLDVVKELEHPTIEPEAEDTPKEEPKDEPKDEPKEEEVKEAPKDAPKEEPKDEFFDEFGGEDDSTPDEDEDKTPESLSKAGKEDWERLRTTKAELKTKLRESETELQELRKQVAELPELRKKAEFAEEAERELALSRVEATREYKEKVAKPLSEIESTALQIAKSNEISADKLFDALSEPDPGKRRGLLKEVTEDMDSVDRDDVFQMARSTQKLLAEQSEIRAKAQEAAKETDEITQKRSAEEQRRFRQEYEKEVEEVVPALRERLPMIELAEGETAEGIFERVKEKAGQEDFSSFSERKKAFLVASGLLMPETAKQLRAAKSKIETLEARVKEFGTKEPRLGDSTSEPPSDDFGGDVEAAVAAALGGKTRQPITEVLAAFTD